MDNIYFQISAVLVNLKFQTAIPATLPHPQILTPFQPTLIRLSVPALRSQSFATHNRNLLASYNISIFIALSPPPHITERSPLILFQPTACTMNEGNSPDPEISFRSPRRSIPHFTGLVVPTPLRALQQREESNAEQGTRHPSEFTALANRLKRIHLENSPSDEKSGPIPERKLPKPIRLFGEDLFIDKENYDNGLASIQTPKENHDRKDQHGELEESGKMGAVDKKITSVPSATDNQIMGPGKLDENHTPSHVPSQTGEDSEEFVDDDVLMEFDEYEDEPTVDAPNTADEVVTAQQCEMDFDLKKEVPELMSPDLQSIHPQIASQSRPEPQLKDVPSNMEIPNNDREETQQEKVKHISEPKQTKHGEPTATVTSRQPEVIAHSNIDSQVGIRKKDDPTAPPLSMGLVNTENIFSSTLHQNVPQTRITGIATLPDVAQTEIDRIIATPNEKTPNTEEKILSEGLSKSAASQLASSTSTDELQSNEGVVAFESQLSIVLGGAKKWSWKERCAAMAEVTTSLKSNPSNGIARALRKRISTLTHTMNNSLDELRPGIITSALNIISTIIQAKLDAGTDFVEQVSPSVMDLSCGKSITSLEAARTFALILQYYPERRDILEDCDDPLRLMKLLESDQESDVVGKDAKERANNACVVLKSVFQDLPASKPQKGSRSPVQIPITPAPLATPRKDPEIPFELPTPTSISRRANARFSQRLNAINGTPTRVVDSSTPSPGRSSTSDGKQGQKGTNRRSIRLGSEGHPATPLIRNKKLTESVRKFSPSFRKKRIYTEEDLEEARRAAMRVVMEEAAQAHANEREKMMAEIASLERKLTKEKSSSSELKEVLGEYEQTMQKMVADGNTQASVYCTSLEKETKKLKAELLEVTEAYETVKEKYDSGKQALSVYENKETRFIEQIRDLKTTMAELQKWSNDLKANTEKKLAKAFESVTSYRASFLDMEARFSKANSDLERLRSDLEKETLSHANTAGKLSKLEDALHTEQDARSSLEASLSATKSSLARVSGQRDKLQKEFSETHDELKKLSAEVSMLSDADVRAKNASKQLETYMSERQALKARAYDDMNRIKQLESELEEKDKDYTELNVICEEAMSQLERIKMKK